MERRIALSVLGVAPIAISTGTALRSPPASAVPHSKQLDPSNPDDLYVIHRKLNYTFDDGLVIWFIQAVRSALVDSKFTPFWNMNVGFISSVRDLEDKRFEVKTMNAIFYTELESAALLETFNNPFTGEKVPVRQPPVRVTTRAYDIAGLENYRSSREGYDMIEYGAIGPAWVIGDDVWCRGDTGFRSEPKTPDGKLSQVNDWFTYQGSIAEISNPDVMSASATQSFTDINTWPSWLNMGDHPGNYASRGFGRKAESIEDMPEAWKAYMKDQYPKEYADPRARLAK